MITKDTLYKRTSTGKVQIWYMEIEDGKFRTISGQKDGKHVTSEWTIAERKNIGRANETSAQEQAELEVAAIYKKKLEQNGYFTTETGIDGDRGLFEPMLAKPFDAERLTPGNKFYIQPKHNGVRCIATKDGLFSRKGKEFVNCPHISKELEPFFKAYPDAKLDGELYNHDYKQDFEKLISQIKKQKPTPATMKVAASVVQLHIYDIPNSHVNFGDRWEELENIAAGLFDPEGCIRFSPTWSSSDEKNNSRPPQAEPFIRL